MSRLPPHHKLYCHALESIFVFLTFAELHAVLRTSRVWMDVVCSMRGLANGKVLTNQHNYDGSGRSTMDIVLASRMARRVGYVGEMRPNRTFSSSISLYFLVLLTILGGCTPESFASTIHTVTRPAKTRLCPKELE
jgi:hypothetical protein